MMKAQFMSLWDGLDTDYNCQVSPQSQGGVPSAAYCAWSCLEAGAQCMEQDLPKSSLPVGDSQHFMGMRGVVSTDHCSSWEDWLRAYFGFNQEVAFADERSFKVPSQTILGF